jgi:hypothetical protein
MDGPPPERVSALERIILLDLFFLISIHIGHSERIEWI